MEGQAGGAGELEAIPGGGDLKHPIRNHVLYLRVIKCDKSECI